MLKHLFLSLTFTLACFSVCGAATESLINIRPEPDPGLMMGSAIELPDGSQTVIIDRRSDGSFVTRSDLVISREGILQSGTEAGKQVKVLESGFVPGAIIRLPNGEQTTIKQMLADGKLLTENGIILTRDGKLTEGEYSGKSASLVSPGFGPGSQVELPDGTREEISEILPDGNLKTKSGAILTKDGKLAEGRNKGKQAELFNRGPKSAAPGMKGGRQADAKSPGAGQKSPEQGNAGAQRGEQAGPAEEASIEDILAATPDQTNMTPEDILGSMPTSTAEAQTGAEETQGKTRGRAAGASQKTKQAGEAGGQLRAEGSPGSGQREARATARKSASKSESQQAGKSSKPGIGQQLRIPPEAARTGNLDFLEGCWQGTRPEYYTKRVIRECFCFGAGGKNGKRRIFDPGVAGMCVGSTSASLSQDGVLSVHSSGAACTSGDKWGQAEMVCRNSGPHTPCSWVFRDARNGRQAYEIPFVRVKTCKR